ncbi:MAG TPA: trypsin-like peptidase domain-containing protein, partial [Vicinamibacteria bacterium]|nr:trypsin-like peptidase domain-containing protein [Vicinamibacteria bacterium]
MRTTGRTRRALAVAGALAVAATPPVHAQTAARRPLTAAIEAPAAPDLVRLSTTIERRVARVRPAVVQVLTTAYTAGETAAKGALLSTQRASGSGVLVSSDGYIVTNAHVVAGARRVQVMLAPPGPEPATPRSILKPPGRVIGAQVVGVDQESDLALLKVVETGLPFLPLGDSEALRQGQI